MPEWIGKTIGKVRIDKYLAHGGMAEVYLGSHLALERPVAIKVLHSHVEQDPDLLARFQREAKVVAGLRHPNIVQIFDFDTTDGHPYIVMEYLKGPTLSTYLRRLHDRDERIPLHQVARLLKVLTAALDYAHGQGVIHRDIKPGNILLHGKADEITLDKPLSNDVEAVITDFGLVRIEHATSQTASGMISGTPAYMSPEQARGAKTDHRTDIYSLGVVLYEMLAGRVPFDADSSLSVIYMQINETPPPIPGIPAAVQEVMNRALVKDPNQRYQTSREMAVDFFLAIGMTAEAQTIHEFAPESAKFKKTMSESTNAEKTMWESAKAEGTRLEQAMPESTRLKAMSESIRSEEGVSESIKPAQSPVKQKPTRSRAWIGVGIFLFLCLLVGGIGGWRVLSALPIFSSPTETSNPDINPTNESTTSSDPVVIPSADGMVKIASGSYEVGLSTEDEYHSAVQNISLNEFWIDQYQTTNIQYQQYLTETGAVAPVIWPSTDNYPVRGVTWDQAAAYCGWANKRLATEAEWEAAGRGPGSSPQLYPWGNDPTNDGQALQLPDQDTYEVGTQSSNTTPSGLYDMVGNVWEWVAEPYGSVQEGYKILRGGRFGIPQDLAYRLAVTPNDERYVKFAGFRCASDQVQ
ncbi:MAG: protein kinase [Anaerolineales bacterium]|nr:protein kinase [Anaerolineales bacterium]